jgi:hypothetical protein
MLWFWRETRGWSWATFDRLGHYWTELGKQISRVSSSPFIAFIIVT